MAMSLKQLEARQDRLSKEAGKVFKEKGKAKGKRKKQLNKRYKVIQQELKKTTNWKNIAKSAWLRKRSKR